MAYSDALRQLYATMNSAADLIDGLQTGTNNFSSVFIANETAADTSTFFDNYGNNTNRANIIFRKSRGGTIGSNVIINNGDTMGVIVWQGANGTGYTNSARIRAVITAAPGASNDMPGTILFDTTDDNSGTLTERMRITNSGFVGINRTSAINTGGLLSVGQSSGACAVESISLSLGNDQSAVLYARGVVSSVAREAFIGVRKHSGITNGCGFIGLDEEDGAEQYLWVTNTGQFHISDVVTHIGTTSGNPVGTQTSDERIKNIKSTPFKYGLADILQLNPIEYALKDDATRDQLGFSAQQVRPILPETVFDTGCPIEGEDPNETKLGMDYSQIIPVLVQAIKELTARLETLENNN